MNCSRCFKPLVLQNGDSVRITTVVTYGPDGDILEQHNENVVCQDCTRTERVAAGMHVMREDQD